MIKQEIDKSNFGYLGKSFQYELVKVFIEEPNFFEETASIVNQNAFTEVYLRTIVGTIKDYYMANGTVPTYNLLEILLKDKAKTQTEIDEYNAVLKKIKLETEYVGCEKIKELALKFFKQQNWIKIAGKILEITKNGDLDSTYAECMKLMEDASTIGQEDDLGYNIYENMDKALARDYTVSIPTGIKQLDDELGGGIDKGKIGLIIAAAGFGKTTLTTAIDAYAATYKCDMNNNRGFKVLQIYFEDDDVDITRKHYSRLLKEEAYTFKRLNPEDKDRIATWLNNFQDKELLKENLRLKKFKTGTKTASDLEAFIKRLRNSGFVPDLITIDYFECILPEKGGYSTDSEWTREGVTMRKLENMAHDFNCAIWVPTQGSKGSMNSAEVVTMDQASGSAKKVHAAQLILSVSRAIDDIKNCKARIAILKNRSGKAGKVFNNVKFDNGTSTIECSDVEVIDGELAWNEKAAEEQEKGYASRMRNLRSHVEEKRENTQSAEGNFVGVISQ